MPSLTERTNAVTALTMALASVRRRWRLRHLAAGAAIAVAALALTMWGAAVVMERLRFSADSILWARIILGFVLAVVSARWLLYPLVRRISDDRLALYLEERVPSLDGAVISAVEMQHSPVPADARSPLLERGLVLDALRRMERSVEVPQLERPATSKALGLTALLMVGLATLLAVGPDYLRQGTRLLLTPWRDPALAPVYSIQVEPGDATVAKGSDVQVQATLAGFSAELVEVVIRRGPDGEWERIAMGIGADSARFTARLFDVAEDAEYFVESSGVRSEVARLTVRNLPAVRTVSVELRYPSYTGLAPETFEDGGDIAALRGTRATIRVRSTMAVRGGRLVLDDGSKIELTPADDTTLATSIIVRRDGFYRIELDADERTRVPGAMEYVVDALDDGAPQITITKPGRDVRPTSVDEVFIEADARDDFGVAGMELVYRVNGGEEKVVALADGSGQRPRELTAGHTLFLEELGLQPGDVIAYYGRVRDNGAGGGQSASSDIYFLTVRPFGREYRQNQQGGGGGGGGGGEEAGALVAGQKEVISATFKAQRDSARTPKPTFKEDVTTIHLSQGRLRTRVKELIARLQRPGVQQADSGFRLLAEIMPKAMEEMQAAEEELVKGGVTAALGPEQRALQWLERAEAVFRDVQVSMQQGGGGGGGGQDANAEDLADLLELETDKLRNQYEQVQRGQQEQAASQADELAERLKRLAARQQQENERQRQMGQRQSGGGGGGGGSQRQLADEAEQVARQLERLARETRSPDLQESARQLQDAANEMRRSAAQNGTGAQGAGAAARDRLEEARRLLDESRQSRNASGLDDASRRAQQLAEQQRDVTRDVGQLGAAGAGANRAERERRIDERKEQMANEVESLERDLDRMARDVRARQPGTARSLQEAAGSIRERRVDDKIRYSRETIRSASPEYASNFEQLIQEDLDQLRDRMAGIASGARAGNDSTQRAGRALDQARDLVRGLASIDERMRERLNRQNGENRQQGSAAGQGRQGEEGQGQQQAAQGQSGQQGQGKQGQQGQQGQGQQGQGQQGQAGQQGQGQGQGQGGQSGQGGQQGGRRGLQQGNQGDQPGQNPSGAMPQGRPSPTGQPGGRGQGGPATFTAEDARQFGRELRAQRDAAEGLRQELRGTGIPTRDLDRLIAQLREMEAGRVFNDPAELERLRGSVLEGMKEFEFGLRRQLGAADRAGPVLGGNDDVPQAYRDMVNEYFRSLSRKPKQ